MSEFSDSPNSSMDRIIRATQWVERFKAKQAETSLNRDLTPVIFRYVLLDNVDPAEVFVRARISYPYHTNADRIDRVTESELHFVGTVLHGQLAGYTGECFWHANVFWNIGKPVCTDRLERFVMRSDWFGGIALATFTMAGEDDPYATGVLEDPDGIFTDQFRMGSVGWSMLTCKGRHFAIQGKCKQAAVTPPEPLGRCLWGSPGAPNCAYTTEANCELVSGIWDEGVPCT